MKHPLATAWAVGLILLFLGTGCPPAPPAERPVFDMSTFRQEIQEMNTRFAQAVQQRDAAMIAQFYAQDARLQPPNQPMIEGQQAIQQYWESLFQVGLQSLSVETVDLGGANGVGYEVGTYRLTVGQPGMAELPEQPGQPMQPGQTQPGQSGEPGQSADPARPDQPMPPGQTAQPRLAPGTDEGKYLIVWRQPQGVNNPNNPSNSDNPDQPVDATEMRWRIAVKAFSSNHPVPGLEPAPGATPVR